MKIYFITYHNTDSDQFLTYKFYGNKKDAYKEISAIKKEDKKVIDEGGYIYDDEPRILEFKNKAELIRELNGNI